MPKRVHQPKRLYREFRQAIDSLHALIDTTQDAIDKVHKAGKNISPLVRTQRSNLKLLLHKLEKERFGK